MRLYAILSLHERYIVNVEIEGKRINCSVASFVRGETGHSLSHTSLRALLNAANFSLIASKER